MVQGCAEILPEWRMSSGVIGGKEQGKHVQKSGGARSAHKNTGDEGYADRKFSVSNQKGDGSCVRQHEVAEDWEHEGVSSVSEKPVDPKLEASAERELRAEDFVLAKYQEEQTHCNAEQSDGTVVARMCVRHARSIQKRDLHHHESRRGAEAARITSAD
jgi:hypothetical protein